jgi:hypothetical protein
MRAVAETAVRWRAGVTSFHIALKWRDCRGACNYEDSLSPADETKGGSRFDQGTAFSICAASWTSRSSR